MTKITQVRSISQQGNPTDEADPSSEKSSIDTFKRAVKSVDTNPADATAGQKKDEAFVTGTGHGKPVSVTGAETALETFLKIADKDIVHAKQRLETDRHELKDTQDKVKALQAEIQSKGKTPQRTEQLERLQNMQAHWAQKINNHQNQIALNQAIATIAPTFLSARETHKDGVRADQFVASARQAFDKAASLIPNGALQEYGALLDDKAVGTLSPEAKQAYRAYEASFIKANTAQAKALYDHATMQTRYAQLQAMTSDPQKYGSVGADVLRELNKTLEPFGLRFKHPGKLDPATAETQLKVAQKQADYHKENWLAGEAAVHAHEANLKLAALEAQAIKNPQQLQEAELSAYKANLQLELALSRRDKVSAEFAVMQGQAAQEQLKKQLDFEQRTLERLRKTSPQAKAEISRHDQAVEVLNERLKWGQRQQEVMAASSDAASLHYQAAVKASDADSAQSELDRINAQFDRSKPASTDLYRQQREAQANLLQSVHDHEDLQLKANTAGAKARKLFADLQVDLIQRVKETTQQKLLSYKSAHPGTTFDDDPAYKQCLQVLDAIEANLADAKLQQSASQYAIESRLTDEAAFKAQTAHVKLKGLEDETRKYCSENTKDLATCSVNPQEFRAAQQSVREADLQLAAATAKRDQVSAEFAVMQGQNQIDALQKSIRFEDSTLQSLRTLSQSKADVDRHEQTLAQLKDGLKWAHKRQVVLTATAKGAGLQSQATAKASQIYDAQKKLDDINAWFVGDNSPSEQLKKQRDEAKANLLKITNEQQDLQLKAASAVYKANKLASDLQVNLAEHAVDVTDRAALSYKKDHPEADLDKDPAYQQHTRALEKAKDNLAYAKLKQAAAQYRVLMTDFAMSLPAKLRAPETEEDIKAYGEAWEKFFAGHRQKLTDFNVAKQIEALHPGGKIDVDIGRERVEQALAEVNKSLAERSWPQQAYQGSRSVLFHEARSDLEKTLKFRRDQLARLESQKDTMSSGDYNAKYALIMGNFETEFSSMARLEHENQANWNQVSEAIRFTLTATAAIGVTISTGGIGAGFLAGFAASEGFDFLQNAVTGINGGDVNRNTHVSMLTYGIDALTGHDAPGEGKRALVDASINAISSFSGARGVSFAAGASRYLASKALPQVLTRLGWQGLSETTADLTQAEIAQTIANNAAQSLTVRLVSPMAGASTFQATVGVGQELSTATELASENKLFTQEGRNELLHTGEEQLRFWGMSTIGGSISGILPRGLVYQLGADGFTNYTMLHANAWVEGRDQLTIAEKLGVVLNPLSGTIVNRAIHTNHTEGQLAQFEERREPSLPGLPKATRSTNWGTRLAQQVYGNPYKDYFESTAADTSMITVDQPFIKRSSHPVRPPNKPSRLKAGTIAATGAVTIEKGIKAARDGQIPIDDMNAAAFASRGGMMWVRGVMNNALKYHRDAMIEHAHVTQESLDLALAPVFKNAEAYGISKDQLAKVYAEKQRFWKDYQNLGKQDLSKGAKYDAMMTEVAQFTRNLEGILGKNPWSYDQFDPRTNLGKGYHAGIVGTYMINTVASSHWALNGHFDLHSPAGIADFAFKSSFFTGNTIAMLLNVHDLAGGYGLKFDPNSAVAKIIQKARGVNGHVFTGAALAWLPTDFPKFLAQYAANNPTGTMTTGTALLMETGFAYGLYRLAEMNSKAQKGVKINPQDMNDMIKLVGASLVIREFLQFYFNHMDDDKRKRH